MNEEICKQLLSFIIQTNKAQDALINRAFWFLLTFALVGEVGLIGSGLIMNQQNELLRQEIKKEVSGREPFRAE